MPTVRPISMDPAHFDHAGHNKNYDLSAREADDSRSGRGNHRLRVDQHVPETMAQALMEAAPFEALPLSKEEMGPILDAVKNALGTAGLTEREAWIVDARIWRQMSVRVAAKELALSKTHLDRIYKVALGKLRLELERNGTAAEWLSLLGTGDDE